MKFLFLLLIGMMIGIAGTFFGFNMIPDESEGLEERAVYKNEELGFTLEYNPELKYIEEYGDELSKVISFRADNAGIGPFGIRVSSISAQTTEEYIDSLDKTEILFKLLPLDSSFYQEYSGAYFIVTDTIVDRDGDTPIYEKVVRGVKVIDDSLFEVLYHNQFSEEEEIEIGYDAVRALSTLKKYQE